MDSPDHIREVDLRPARLHLAGRKFFVANPRTPQAIDRAALEGIIPLGRHPQNAGAVQAPAFPPALVAGPELERPCRHFGVGLVGPISTAHDPRFPAGRGA